MKTDDLSTMTGAQFRALCRRGEFDRPTAGVARGFVQANLVILREHAARDFERFCRLNPRPCPLLEVTPPGDYEPVGTAPGADVRTDLPRYRVFRGGVCVERPTSVVAHWPDRLPPTPPGPAGRRPVALAPASDLVAFLIGCSFTFETALLDAGIPVRHMEENRNVPMFRTNIPCEPSGPFRGPLVVSMRPMTPAQAQHAAEITAAFPRVHGAPIQVGDPQKLGIRDLDRPDYGDAVTIRPGEVPVFWACGVTPMEAILAARLDVAITHEPGHMFVTDLTDESLREPRRTDA